MACYGGASVIKTQASSFKRFALADERNKGTKLDK